MNHGVGGHEQVAIATLNKLGVGGFGPTAVIGVGAFLSPVGMPVEFGAQPGMGLEGHLNPVGIFFSEPVHKSGHPKEIGMAVGAVLGGNREMGSPDDAFQRTGLGFPGVGPVGAAQIVVGIGITDYAYIAVAGKTKAAGFVAMEHRGIVKAPGDIMKGVIVGPVAGSRPEGIRIVDEQTVVEPGAVVLRTEVVVVGLGIAQDVGLQREAYIERGGCSGIVVDIGNPQSIKMGTEFG